MCRKAIFYVYVLFDFLGVPRYVGKGKDDRWLDHENRLDKCTNPMLRALVRRAKRRGREIPKIKVREWMREDDAFALEIALIAAIGRRNIGTGPLANLDKGGRGSSENGGKRPPVSAETREKIAAARRGKKNSEAQNAKIGNSLRGRPKTAEHNQAVAASLRGRKVTFGWWSTPEGREKQRRNNPGNRGSRTPEMRARISASVKATMTEERIEQMRQAGLRQAATEKGYANLVRASARGAAVRWGHEIAEEIGT